MDTIFALATASGRAGVAVVRISGPSARKSAERLAGPLPVDGRRYAKLRDETGHHLDTGLVLTFAEGKSFTGDETVEFQLHGAPVVVRSVLEALAAIPALRPAVAGEFTRRAFENGRLDLAQVEGLSDLLEAETERQRVLALNVLSGGMSRRVEAWRQKLVEAMALVEATIDFADEDVPVDVAPDVERRIGQLIEEIETELSGLTGLGRLREGFEVAIVGSPNAGKSTLLNRLVGRDAALTSSIAGTTRDVIEVKLEIDGLPVTVLDTAGLRDTSDPLETLGVARAKERAENADLRVYLVSPDEKAPQPQSEADLVVNSKVDLTGLRGISGLSGEGVDELVNRIAEVLGQRVSDSTIMSRERHRIGLLNAVEGLRVASSLLPALDVQSDLVAEELRRSVRALEGLVGRIDVEHVLGEIFASFCIGK